MVFCLIYHADSAIAHTLAAFFHFFQNAFRLAGIRPARWPGVLKK